jgi:hypothetical protein
VLKTPNTRSGLGASSRPVWIDSALAPTVELGVLIEVPVDKRSQKEYDYRDSGPPLQVRQV